MRAGGPPQDAPPLSIAWALLRNVRTLFGRASATGGPARAGSGRPGAGGASGEEAAAQAAEHDVEVTSAVAASATEVRDLGVSNVQK